MTVCFHALQSFAYETEKVASDTNAAETFQLRFFQSLVKAQASVLMERLLYNEFERTVCVRRRIATQPFWGFWQQKNNRVI